MKMGHYPFQNDPFSSFQTVSSRDRKARFTSPDVSSYSHKDIQGSLHFNDKIDKNLYYDSFHTRADSKLQWRIVIVIYEIMSVHTREQTSPNLRFSIPEQGEEAWLVSVFFWYADCYFIWDRISIRRCTDYQQKWLEGHVALPPPPPKKKNHNLEVKAFIRWFRCMIWEMCPLKNTSGPRY